MRTDQTRMEWIDFCRGIGIMLVVLGHCNPPFNKIIYGFHMPLFFIISGFLYKPSKSYVKKYFIRYIIPYFILSCMNLIIQILVDIVKNEGLNNLSRYIVGILFSRGTTLWMPNCSPLWFMTCLFCAMVIYNTIKQYSSAVKWVIIILGIAISYTFQYFDIANLPWNINVSFMGVFFLAMGDELKKYINLIKSCAFNREILLISLIIGVIAIWINPVEKVDFDAGIYGNLILMLIGGTLPSCVLLVFCNMRKTKQTLISFWGRHTIFVMGFDYLSGTVARAILNLTFHSTHFIFQFFLKFIILALGYFCWNAVCNKLPDKLSKLLSF